jgi:hypothetical protein
MADTIVLLLSSEDSRHMTQLWYCRYRVPYAVP